MSVNHYVTNRHPEYQKNQVKRDLVQTMYTGEGVEQLLTRKTLTESDDEYSERKRVAGYENNLAHIVHAHAGMIYQHEPVREWGPLGDVNDPSTVAYRFYRDADGDNTNYPVLVRKAINEILLNNEVWCFVNGENEQGLAPVHILSASDVVNWSPDRTSVLIKHGASNASELWNGTDDETEHFTLFTADGYERLTVHEDSVSTEGFVPFEVPYVNISGKRVPPVFRVSLPIEQYVTHSLAKYALNVYEAESVLNMAYRTTSFNKLVIPAKDDDRDTVLQGLAAGMNVMFIDPETSNMPAYITPRADNVDSMKDNIERMKKGFYRTAFKDYERSARVYQTASATAADRQDSTSAYLALLAMTMEEFEHTLLYMVCQSLFPGQKDKWNVNVVYDKEYDIPEIEINQSGSLNQKENSYED